MPKFRSISDVIGKEKEFEQIRKKTKEQEILVAFNKIFPDLKNIVEVKRVVKKTLCLRVENSVWRSELNLRRQELVYRLNNHFKEEAIKEIKFV